MCKHICHRYIQCKVLNKTKLLRVITSDVPARYHRYIQYKVLNKEKLLSRVITSDAPPRHHSYSHYIKSSTLLNKEKF